MGEADKQRRRAAKEAKKREEAAAKEAARRAARRGGKPPQKKGGDKTSGTTKPQPDTTNRNQPCNKALAHKVHDAHRYRRGDVTMHCPGVV